MGEGARNCVTSGVVPGQCLCEFHPATTPTGDQLLQSIRENLDPGSDRAEPQGVAS